MRRENLCLSLRHGSLDLGTCRPRIFTSKTSFPHAGDGGALKTQPPNSLGWAVEARLSEHFFFWGEEGGGKLPLSCRSEGPCCSVIAD